MPIPQAGGEGHTQPVFSALFAFFAVDLKRGC
jgi:hypothetical protein